MASAPLTRIVLRRQLEYIGLPGLIAPSARKALSADSLLSFGLVDLDTSSIIRVIPLAVIFMAKLLLSNLAFAYVITLLALYFSG